MLFFRGGAEVIAIRFPTYTADYRFANHYLYRTAIPYACTRITVTAATTAWAMYPDVVRRCRARVTGEHDESSSPHAGGMPSEGHGGGADGSVLRPRLTSEL
eukprot:1984834-Prymnesium_polylepis.1